MNDEDFRTIEASVGFPLPGAYRATMASYPFAADSVAAESMLPNDASAVIDLNVAKYPCAGIGRPFFIGDDSGEERFFVDASTQDSGVFVFELETGRVRLLVASWGKFLEYIRAQDAEIAADQEAMRQRKLNKKWWEFWK